MVHASSTSVPRYETIQNVKIECLKEMLAHKNLFLRG